MSFFEGDTRTGEQPAPPPRALTPVEIGAIVGTLTVFVGVVGSLLFYRAHTAKKRREKNGERVDDDELQLQGTGNVKSEDGSFRPEVRVASLPPPPPRTLLPRNKKVWGPYEGAQIEEDKDFERAESHEMQDGKKFGVTIKREAY
ncbi:uncharacterized protein GLRG_10132 [Colletotrichum graminicola M1.001]|uniref:Uncharacterized protein n=1 Tax=Colletotrichum graminicola (strain M1.001 / M2 / FGSC 10212) TaxID=645133 RepID=E3QVV0_COLGM|nr:uncharacterized protein GLRG_10132 [Colletotrichum graminicola M1.001]EFQ34988.1 hypothetical protein GLRG_10132 [Colletotrichum graminicola M1.001]